MWSRVTDSLLMNRKLCKWWNVISEIKLWEKYCGFHLSNVSILHSLGLLSLEAYSCHVMRQPKKRTTWRVTSCYKTSCWKKYDKPCVSIKSPSDNLNQESVLTGLMKSTHLYLALISWKEMSKRTNRIKCTETAHKTKCWKK